MSGTAEFLRRLIISGGIINLVIIAEYILMLTIVAERLVYYFMTSYNRKNCSRFCTLSRLTNVEPTRCQVYFLKIRCGSSLCGCPLSCQKPRYERNCA